MIKEAKSAFWDFGALTVAQSLVLFLAVVYTTIIARALGPEQFGILALFLSIMHFVFRLGASWTGAAVTKFGKEELERYGRMSAVFWARALIITLILGFFFIILLFVQQYVKRYLGITDSTFWLLPLLILVYSLMDYGAWVMKTTNQMKPYAGALLLRQILILGLLAIATVSIARISLPVVITIELISYVLIIVFMLFFIKRNVYTPFLLNKGIFLKILFYSWPFIFSFLSGYFVDWVDLFIIKYYFSFKEAGIYQLAYRIYFYLSSFLTSITTLFFPILVAAALRGKEFLIKDFYIRRFSPQAAFIWGAAVSLIIIFSGIFFTRIFGQNYAQAVMPFKIICLCSAVQILAFLYSSVLLTFSKLERFAFVHVATAVINVILDFILVPLMGINGAALATTIAISFSVVRYVSLAQHHYNIKDFRAFYFMLLPASVFVFSLIFKSIFNQLLFFMAAAIASVLLARSLKIFSKADIPLVKAVHMPEPVKNAVISVYSGLSQ